MIEKDGEPPVVDYCPPSQKHKIEKHHESIKVSWIEPKFSDNVKVTDVTQTNVSEKKYFFLGRLSEKKICSIKGEA